MTTISETCACGATFTTTGTWAASNAAEWRKGHRHVESGPCTSVLPALVLRGQEVEPPFFCALKAGHTGAHTDGEGATWMEAPQNGTEAAPGATDSPSRVSPVIREGESA